MSACERMLTNGVDSVVRIKRATISLLRQYRSRVKTIIGPEHCQSRLRISLHQSLVDSRSASVAGKQRRVEDDGSMVARCTKLQRQQAMLEEAGNFS